MDTLSETPSKEQELCQDLSNSLSDWFKTEMANYGNRVDPVLLSRMTVVAMAGYSAMLAVDVGMPPENFTAVCGASYKQAYDKAPKFG